MARKTMLPPLALSDESKKLLSLLQKEEGSFIDERMRSGEFIDLNI